MTEDRPVYAVSPRAALEALRDEPWAGKVMVQTPHGGVNALFFIRAALDLPTDDAEAALRDQFAVGAYPAIHAHHVNRFGHPCDYTADRAARDAYAAADRALSHRARLGKAPA